MSTISNQINKELATIYRLCYLPKPKAEADNTNRSLDNSDAIMRKPNPIIVLLCIYLSKCSMCSLNKKYHPLFELLHKTALAYLQAFVCLRIICFLFFQILMKNFQFTSLSSRRRSKSSADNVANLDVDSAMTKLLKLLFSVLGDVTFACIKTIVCRYDVTSTCIKTIVCRYDVTETQPARISCVLVANQN